MTPQAQFDVTVNDTARVRLPIELRWHGRGGQGVVTASRLFAVAVLRAGFYPQSLPDFGAERSGAPLQCYTRIGNEAPTLRGPVTAPDAVIVLDPTLVGAIDVLDGAVEGAPLVVNTVTGPEVIKATLDRDDVVYCTVDGSAIATEKIGRPIPNVPLIGALLRVVPLIDIDAMRDVVLAEMSERFPQKIAEGNAEALIEGYETAEVAGPA